jgi:hypothetical protein
MRALTPLFPPFSGAAATLGDGLGDIPAGFTAPVQRRMQITGSMHQGLRLSLREPLALIGFNTYVTGSPPAGLIMQASIDGTSVQSQAPYVIGLSPFRLPMYQGAGVYALQTGMAFAQATFLEMLAICFSKYRVKRAIKLHYRPLVSTTDAANFGLAVTADGAHPVAGINGTNASGYANFPTLATLENGPTSISFASWMPWSVEWNIDNAEKYTYCLPNYTSSAYPEADIRTTCFGSLACITGTVGSVGTKGMLYWELEVDLLDPYPLYAVAASLSREVGLSIGPNGVRLPPRARAAPIESKDGVARVDADDDDDFVSPSPPRSVALRGAHPSPPVVPSLPDPPPRTPSVKKS